MTNQIRMRKDLEFFERPAKSKSNNSISDKSQSTWVVKDPLTFEHFLFSSNEYFLLKQLDGSRSLDGILRNWKMRFQTHSLSLVQLQNFVRRLVIDNLAIVDRIGAAGLLTAQHQRISTRNKTSWLKNPLAIRFRGINPTGILKWFDWVGLILFQAATMIAVLAASFFVLVYMFGHFDDVAARVPAIQQILSVSGLLSIVLTIAIVKVFHEFGHALAVRRFGGECFEIGVILLVMIPTLYCNVSDAWTFRERWKRIVVSFAGMYVEIILATLAAIAWMSTSAGSPNFLNAILFNIVLLCSLNTLLVNGNPLLRYDGYFMLADWWEKPNLSQLARQSVSNLWLSCFLKPAAQTRQKKSTQIESVGLLVYGCLALVYRWFVLCIIVAGIVWMVGRAGSLPLGYGLGGLLLGGLLMTAAKQNIAMAQSSAWHGVSLLRSAVSIGVLALIGLAMWLVPLHSSVYGDAKVEPLEPARVYAPADGQLEFVVKTGRPVKRGEIVAQLVNPNLIRKLEIHTLDKIRQESHLKELRSRVNSEPGLATSIETAKAALNLAAEFERLLTAEVEALTVRAQTDGVVYCEPARILKNGNQIASNDLTDRPGFIGDSRNQNCFVSRGQPLLTIFDPAEKIVALDVLEGDIELIAVGQPAQIWFDQAPNELKKGVVSKIIKQELPSEFNRVSDAESNTYVDAQGMIRQLETPYRIEISDVDVGTQVRAGSGGRAKISVRHQTVAEQLVRMLE